MLGGGDQSMSEAAKAVLRFTRREIGKALAAALGLGLLPQAADAFRPHFFPGGVVGSGSAPHFTGVTLSSQSTLSGTTFTTSINVTKSNGAPYTGPTPTLGGANASLFNVTGSAPVYQLNSNAALGTGSDSGVYDITLTVSESDCSPTTFTTGTLAIAWSSTTLTLGNSGDMVGAVLRGTTTNSQSTILGAPTREFGWVFPPGYIQSGEIPVFTDVATGGVIPYSSRPINAKRFWPAIGSISGSAGSLMADTFMLRLDGFTIPPGGTRAINISKTTGSWPAATRTTAEVLAQNFAVNCPPYSTLGTYDPTVAYGAWLSTANASNLLQTRHWLTGDAGDVWCFTYAMSQTVGGTPHPQLTCNIYMEALTYRPGGTGATELGGFRFASHIRQPYFDVDSTPKQTRWFASPVAGSPSAGVNYEVNGSYFVPPNWPAGFTSGLTFTVQQASVNTGIWSGKVCNGNRADAGTTLIFDGPVGPQGNGGNPSIGAVVTDVGNNLPPDTIITGMPVTTATCSISGDILTINSALGGAGAIIPSSELTWSGQTNGVQFPGTSVNDVIYNESGVIGTQITLSNGFNPTVTNVLVTFTSTSIFAWVLSASALVVDGVNNITYYALNANMDSGNTQYSTPFYSGGDTIQVTPAFVTQGAGQTLPSNFGPGFGWIAAQGASPNYNLVYIADTMNGAGNNYPQSFGTGTLTVPFLVLPFNRMRIESADCEYVFFAGTGSMATDTPAYSAQVDKTAWVASQVIPPFGTTLTGQYQSTSGAIEDTTFLWDQHPYSHGESDQASESTGNPPYINPIPNNDMIEFYNGSPGSLRNSICKAGTAAPNGFDIKNAASPNAQVNMLVGSYTGMGASQTALNIVDGTFVMPGHTVPANPTGPSLGALLGGIGLPQGTDHQSNYAGWAARRTGRLDHLDFVMDQAGATGLSQSAAGSYIRNPVLNGTTYTGTDVMFNVGQRAMSWQTRNACEAFLLFPSDPSGTNNPGNVAFDGTQQPQYLIDRATNDMAVAWVYANAGTNGLIPTGPIATYFGQVKPWMTFDGLGNIYADTEEWQTSFLMNSVAFFALHGIPNATNVAEYWVAHCSYAGTHFGFYCFSTINMTYALPSRTAGAGEGTGPISNFVTSDDGVFAQPENGAGDNPTWSATPIGGSGSYWAWDGENTNFEFEGFVDGDRCMFPSTPFFTAPLPGGYAYNTSYYFVNVSTPATVTAITFDLSATSGGSPVVPTNNGTTNGTAYMLPPVAGRELEYSGYSFGFNYEKIFFQSHCHIKSVLTVLNGSTYTGGDDLIDDALNRDLHGPGGSGTGYMLNFQSGPNSSWADCRYAYQQAA
jgi:hypothetical protein